MEAIEAKTSSFLNEYVEPYLFPIISGGILLMIALVILHLNSTFIGSPIVARSTFLILGAIWGLMLWVNYGEMSLSTVLQIIMAIIMMITVYLFLLFVWAGKDCQQEMGIWEMIKSIL